VSTLRAVLPASIRRRWDALALEQLCELVVALEARNEELIDECVSAQRLADHWFENCQQLPADAPGLTIDGRIVRADGPRP